MIPGVSELTKFALSIAIVFYSIGVVFSLVKANISYMSGGPEKYSDALEKVVIMSILLAAAFIVERTGGTVVNTSAGEDGTAPVWKEMAKIIISVVVGDRKSTRLNSSHPTTSRMPSSA